jgi:hypothetical protein
VLVSNHSSHLDTPAILRALPAGWRRLTVVAAAADHFYQRRSVASGVSLLFNTVPVSRTGGGADALEHIQELVADGWNLLIDETPAQLMARVSAFYATAADDPPAAGPPGAWPRRAG